MSTASIAPPRTGGRVLELAAAQTFELVARDRPDPGLGELTVEIVMVGICGTDLHYFAGRRPAEHPMVLGHDAVGYVVACGSGVDPVLLGRRVTIDPTVACGHCDACAEGQPDRCAHHAYLGMTVPGCLAEFVTIPAGQAVPLPESMPDESATVLEPVAVTLEMLERVRPLLDGPRPAAIVGGGPLGVVMASLLQGQGRSVTVYETSAVRRQLANRLGVTAHHPDDAQVLSEPGLVVETSATAAGVDLAARIAARRSVVAVVGGASVGIPMHRILVGDLTVTAVLGGAGHYAAAVELADKGAVLGRELITHRYPFMDAQDAFEAVASDKDRVMRALLERPWGSRYA